MTASKSNRARRARAGATGTSAGSSSAGSSAGRGRPGGQGPGGQGGTAVAARGGAGARGGATAQNGTTARKGAAAQNGAAARKGAAARGGGAARGGAAERVPRARVGQDDLGGAQARTGGLVPLWLQLTTFALALAGLGVSTYLTVAHFTDTVLAGCSEKTGVVNCTKVTTSAQSYVFGIPVAVLGLAFYVFVVAIMSPWAWRAARREIHLARIAAMVAGIGFVLYLLYAELYMIGSICLYCTSVHAITFVLFVLTVVAVATWGLVPARQADEG
jgi:uncharacterized membrane protein